MESFLLQLIASVAGLCVVWIAQSMGRKFLGPPKDPVKRKALARQHFSKAAQLLEKSHSSTGTPEALSLAKDANTEIDKAIALDSKDVSFHVLKSYALEQQGLLPGAIDSLNIALSDDMENVMIPSEMCDALLRRASLLLSSSKGRRNVDVAIPDLQKCLQITPDNPKVLCKLGLCYERNKSFADAERIYERVLTLDFKSQEARAGLKRLRP
ncbi:hypothetical protein GOP47_0000919 [Adiantum capillus-veneris]|uniref:Uncharacterized protein n=1 Tax=Adiantum capillus-veneris TaxID=13818 RepID=A0A9D4VDW3_ADICA|nr:hypothetical protein GOP47_0000919 [Adiantum capillus-veneris]